MSTKASLPWDEVVYLSPDQVMSEFAVGTKATNKFHKPQKLFFTLVCQNSYFTKVDRLVLRIPAFHPITYFTSSINYFDS